MNLEKEYKGKRVFVIVDNIRSAFNVGSIFRTCDGVGDCMILICGISPTPENPKVLKTSLSAEKTVPWEYFDKTEDAIQKLKDLKIDIFAVELTKHSQNYTDTKFSNKVAVIFGHEKRGVSDDVINLTKGAISVPMNGQKRSLNVAVCAGIILYEIKKKLNES